MSIPGGCQFPQLPDVPAGVPPDLETSTNRGLRRQSVGRLECFSTVLVAVSRGTKLE